MVRYLISIGKGKKEGKMLFDVYGANAGFQWLGLFMVLGALILLNEFARRTKAGGKRTVSIYG